MTEFKNTHKKDESYQIQIKSREDIFVNKK